MPRPRSQILHLCAPLLPRLMVFLEGWRKANLSYGFFQWIPSMFGNFWVPGFPFGPHLHLTPRIGCTFHDMRKQPEVMKSFAQIHDPLDKKNLASHRRPALSLRLPNVQTQKILCHILRCLSKRNHVFFMISMRMYIYIYIYQHLQKGAKCFLKGVNSPFLRV